MRRVCAVSINVRFICSATPLCCGVVCHCQLMFDAAHKSNLHEALTNSSQAWNLRWAQCQKFSKLMVEVNTQVNVHKNIYMCAASNMS